MKKLILFMKKLVSVNLLIILYIVAIQICLIETPILQAQGWSQYYDIQPDIQNCISGKLKDSEKQKVLDYTNYIRSLHKLKPVYYKFDEDYMTKEAALIIVANATLNHQPPSSYHCYSAEGYDGSLHSNLHGNYYTNLSQVPTSESSVKGWMIDDYTGTLGHRRAIINPFLKYVSFGRCDGQPLVAAQYPYVTGMCIKVFNDEEQYLGDWNEEFVACPFENYPPDIFKKDWLLSFSIFFDKVNSRNNGNVDYSMTTVEVKDQNGSPMSVSEISYNLENWGDVPNVLTWKVAGLQDYITYNVNVKNVKISGVSKNYSYWFNFNNSTMTAPDVPTLQSPPNDSSNVAVMNSKLQWNPAQRAYYYHLQISKTDEFAAGDIVLEDAHVTNYSYTMTGLESNTTYYWHVKAINEGGASNWSPVWRFKTGYAIPSVPSLLGPITGSTVSLQPYLQWEPASNASSYELQIAPNRDFWEDELIIWLKDYNQTSYRVPAGKLEDKLQYYWRVKANGLAGVSDWSSKWRFYASKDVSVNDLTSNTAISLLNLNPNPVSDRGTLLFNVTNSDLVRIAVYNTLGREIMVLVNGRYEKGEYNVEFSTEGLPAGIYYIRYFNSTFNEVNKIQVVK